MVSVSYNPLQLYHLIEGVILEQTEDQYPFAKIYEQEQSLYSFRQENLTSTQCYERFNTKIDVGTAIGVTRQHEALLNYFGNENTARATYETLAGADKLTVRNDDEEQYISYVFLRQSGTQHANLKEYL